MPAIPVDLIGGFYTDDCREWACQDTVNYLPVAAEVAGTKTRYKLADVPGLKPWAMVRLPVSEEVGE